jgi:hypothetical protein
MAKKIKSLKELESQDSKSGINWIFKKTDLQRVLHHIVFWREKAKATSGTMF